MYFVLMNLSKGSGGLSLAGSSMVGAIALLQIVLLHCKKYAKNDVK